MKEQFKMMTLSQVSDFEGGSQPPKSEFVDTPREGYIRLLQIRDFKSDNKAVYIPISTKNRICEERDIMIGRYGASVGQIHRGKTGAYNVALIKAKPNEDFIDRDYFYFYLLSPYFQNYLFKISDRSAQAGFSKQDIASFEVPIIPISEQRRIVAILDDAFARIDKAIANTEKNIANAKELFESTRYSLMNKKDNNLKQLCVEDVAVDFEYGTSEKSSQNGSVAVLRMGNIQNGKIDWSDLVYTSNDEDIKKLALNYDDVLFNRTNSDVHVGKTAIYKGEYPAIFAGYLIRILTDKNIIVPDYLNYYLNGFEAREYGKSVMSRSVNQANINCSKLKKYPIPVPPLQIQRSIVKVLIRLEEQTQAQASLMENKLAALHALKQSLLAAAFSGELTADFTPDALEL